MFRYDQLSSHVQGDDISGIGPEVDHAAHAPERRVLLSRGRFTPLGKANLLGANRVGARSPKHGTCRIARKEVRCANEPGHECRCGMFVDICWGSHLFNCAAIEHGNATNFIARVICCVDLTDRRRRRRSRRLLPIVSPRRRYFDRPICSSTAAPSRLIGLPISSVISKWL